MSLLTAFEAAARLNSFTAAADELSITQSAVSRQIRLLEEQVGCQLFTRDRQSVRLSEAGAIYARDIREALQRIGSASLNLRVNPMGGTLNLAILPTFGTRWLAPRLPDFLAANHGVTLSLSTRLVPFDFAADPLDAAIHFGEAPWPGTEGVELMGETVLPLCSPQFRDAHKVEAIADLLALPLLHLSSRPHQWSRWFAAQGVDAEHVHEGMVFDQFAMAAQAATAGLGIALLPGFLCTHELANGDLVPIAEISIASQQRYWLVWPDNRAQKPPLQTFRQWLVSVSAQS